MFKLREYGWCNQRVNGECGGVVKLSLTEIMRALQDFGAFIVIILLAYVVYKVAILLEAMSNRIKGEKD